MNKKCETCESLSTSHVEAVTRQLQHAMAGIALGSATGRGHSGGDPRVE
jgi:hypothetical protein